MSERAKLMLLRGKMGLRAAVLLSLTSSVAHLRADVVQIENPSQSYLSRTQRIDFDQFSFPVVSQISNSTETIVYDSPLLVGAVPEFWASWNSPPAVETSTPVVGWTEGRSELFIQLSSPVATFGFELEPEQLETELVSAFFFTAGGSVYQIDRTPSGAGGALLFAASVAGDAITDVYVEDASSDDFAIADQRYSSAYLSAVPEPQSFLPILLGIATLVYIRLKWCQNR